ncbi:MAG TPA: hypothetical protein VNQ76_01900 [Planctomicrobium sp.]|nr:hypothetical protein [Planctomicrobium sp.]
MALFDLPRPEFLASGEKARLIPSVADTSRECRITSILLATMMSVEEFGKGLLGSLGVRVGKTSKIQGFTEIVFKGDPTNRIRPDGLLIVKTGNKEWRALVESKIGKADLNKEQIESYLDLCKEHGIDAVITISNLSVADSTHHPLQLNKIKLRNASVYHWSWMYLITEAIMWTKHYGVADHDQGYILTEFARYLQHPSSGITSFDRMNSEWKDVCGTIHSGMPVNKASTEVSECVGSWHQFIRSLSLEMSVAVGQSVTVPMKREYLQDSMKRLSDDCQSLATDHRLDAEFDIPHAASRIRYAVDFKRRTVSCSMKLKAPEDRVRAKARINWILSQLKNVADDRLIVKVSWPFRTPDTFATLAALKANPDVALSDKTTSPPVAFEIIVSRDLAGRFKGAQTFVQDTQGLILEFYEKVGQHLREWVPPPPKVSFSDPGKVLEGTIATRANDDPLIVPDASVEAESESTSSQEKREHSELPTASNEQFPEIEHPVTSEESSSDESEIRIEVQRAETVHEETVVE